MQAAFEGKIVAVDELEPARRHVFFFVVGHPMRLKNKHRVYFGLKYFDNERWVRLPLQTGPRQNLVRNDARGFFVSSQSIPAKNNN